MRRWGRGARGDVGARLANGPPTRAQAMTKESRSPMRIYRLRTPVGQRTPRSRTMRPARHSADVLLYGLALCTLCLIGAAPSDAPRRQPAGPFAPREALTKFRIDERFRIELVAAEPDVMDPVDLAFDADGRMFVVEMRGYPFGQTAGGGPPGRIKLLEDADGDGRIDRSRVFVDGLSRPTGVAV